MGRWIPYLAVGVLIASVAVVVYQKGDERLVGTWVLDADAVALDKPEAQRRVWRQLLEAVDFRFAFTARRMQVGMTTKGERRQRTGKYRIVRENEDGLDLEFDSKSGGLRACRIEFTDRGMILHWNKQALPLRRE